MVDVLGQRGQGVSGHVQVLTGANSADHVYRGQFVAAQVQRLH